MSRSSRLYFHVKVHSIGFIQEIYIAMYNTFRYLSAVIVVVIVGFTPPKLNATTDWCVKYISDNTPMSIDPEDVVTIHLTVQNCGVKEWLASEVFASYHWYEGNQIVKWQGIQSPLPKNILPGAVSIISMEVKAPIQVNKLTLKFDLVKVWNVRGKQQEVWFSELKNPTLDRQVNIDNSIYEVQGLVEKVIEHFSPPTIKNIIYYKGIHPKQKTLVTGEGFGTKEGKVVAQFPSGYTVNCKILGWWHNVVYIEVPDIYGELNGTINFQIVKHTQKKSNSVSLPFFADYVVQPLQSSDFIRTHYDKPKACLRDFFSGLGGTISGSAYSQASFLFFIGQTGCNGKDAYALQTPLINDWLIEKTIFKFEGVDYYGGQKDITNCIGNGCPRAHYTKKQGEKGSNYITVDIYWDTGSTWNRLRWGLSTYIFGPKGVQYLTTS